jgi:hypothetical protein
MKTLLRYAGWAAVVLAPTTLLVALLVERAFSTDVQIVTPGSPEEVRVNRGLWQKGDPVAEIYGVPMNEKTEVLFVDATRLVRPPEDPSLVLLPVDKAAGENPLQVRTLWFLAWRVALGFGLAGLLALVGVRWVPRAGRPGNR